MRLSSSGLVAAAEASKGFTFAYLKEATLSALMQWINEGTAASMDAVLASVIEGLNKEIASLPAGGAPNAPERSLRPPWDQY